LNIDKDYDFGRKKFFGKKFELELVLALGLEKNKAFFENN
jgi:hypothetical protein